MVDLKITIDLSEDDLDSQKSKAKSMKEDRIDDKNMSNTQLLGKKKVKKSKLNSSSKGDKSENKRIKSEKAYKSSSDNVINIKINDDGEGGTGLSHKEKKGGYDKNDEDKENLGGLNNEENAISHQESKIAPVTTQDPTNKESKETNAITVGESAPNTRPKVKWEQKWILIPNVFEFSSEIWLKKWVQIDSGEENTNERPQSNQTAKDKSSGGLNNGKSSPNENQKNSTVKKVKHKKENLPRKYVCPIENCGKIFYDSSSFRKHQVIHGERHYICPYPGCGKKFLDNSKLRRHQLVHSGEKAYKCDICGKRFSLDFNLKTHFRTHTGEKPYICRFKGCEKRFTQSSNLTAHEKTHKELMLKESMENNKSNSGNYNTVNGVSKEGNNCGDIGSVFNSVTNFISVKKEEETVINASGSNGNNVGNDIGGVGDYVTKNEINNVEFNVKKEN